MVMVSRDDFPRDLPVDPFELHPPEDDDIVYVVARRLDLFKHEFKRQRAKTSM